MTIAIRNMPAAEAEGRLNELGAILLDAVEHGASVNFMAGLEPDEAADFWRRQLPGIAAGEKRLFVAEDGGQVVGTILLMFAQQPNAPHRAEVGKMLVHSDARRRGLGRRLLQAAEAEARAEGRSLLMLDTESGSAGEHLYKACGWTEFGRVPGHSRKPGGPLAETTFFYKLI